MSCFLFTHCHVVPNQFDFLSSVKRYFGGFGLFGILKNSTFWKKKYTDLKCAISSKTVIFMLTQNTSSQSVPIVLRASQVRILSCYGHPEFESRLVDLSSILPPSLSPKFSFCPILIKSEWQKINKYFNNNSNKKNTSSCILHYFCTCMN